MKWRARYRRRLRAALRAALGAWREQDALSKRGVVRFTWQQDVTEECLTDAVPGLEHVIAAQAAHSIQRAIRAERQARGAV